MWGRARIELLSLLSRERTKECVGTPPLPSLPLPFLSLLASSLCWGSSSPSGLELSVSRPSRSPPPPTLLGTLPLPFPLPYPSPLFTMHSSEAWLHRSRAAGLWSVLCRALSLALSRREPTGRPQSTYARAAETEAHCVVRAAGAHAEGGIDPAVPRCTVGSEDGTVYRAWRWLTVAWPLNLLIYLLSIPVAELAWWFASRHYVRVRSAMPHVVRLGLADAAIALRFYRRAARERTPAELAMVLLRWFHGDWPSRAQVREFFGWTVYNSLDRPLTRTQAAAIDSLVDEFEQVLDRPFAPEHESARDWMRYTREPLANTHKPLWFYLVLQTNMRLLGLSLRRRGFKLLRAGSLRYWYRPAKASGDADGSTPPLPIVFLHGVLGLMPYRITIDVLSQEHNGALYFPIFPTWAVSAAPSVRLGECERPIQLPEILRSIRQMLKDHGATQAAFFANSVGTGLLGAMLERAPELAACAVMSDPICFELSSGDVLHNFLYAQPKCCGGLWPVDLVRAQRPQCTESTPSVVRNTNVHPPMSLLVVAILPLALGSPPMYLRCTRSSLMWWRSSHLFSSASVALSGGHTTISTPPSSHARH